MKLLQSLPQPGKTVARLNVPASLVSTVKASMLAGVNPTEFRITPDLLEKGWMRVNLPVFGVVGVSVYEDGEDKLIRLYLKDQ